MADGGHALDTNKEVLKTFTIKGNIPGENIQDAVNMLLSIGELIYNLYATTDYHGNDLPDNTVGHLLTALSTTSVDDFNSKFIRIQEDFTMKAAIKMNNILQRDAHTSISNNWSSFQQICSLGTTVYTSMTNAKTWTAVTETPPGTSSFVTPDSSDSDPSATSLASDIDSDPNSQINCFNCGGKHHVNKCCKPRNRDRIKQACKKHRAKA